MQISLYFRKTAIVMSVVGLGLVSCKKETELTAVPAPATLSNTAVQTAAVTATQAVSLTGSTLEIGINGHPLGTAPYTSTPATTQISLLKDMNMTWYRVDVMSTSDGSITVPNLWNPLRQAADAGGVKILPMLYPRTIDYTVSEAESYNRGKKIGSDFAAKYGSYFTYYNLGNELDLKCLLSGKDGRKSTDYNQAKYQIIRGYLRGMDEGIKSKDQDAKTMIDASWVHYGFLQMLDSDNVKFDIVAYHWYSEMEGAAAKSPYYITDITQKLSSLFPNKPIWITELNNRYKSTNTTYEADQNTFISNFIQKCKNNPQVKVAMVYELFNEPDKSELEGNYGILKWTTKYTKWTNKIIASTFYSAAAKK